MLREPQLEPVEGGSDDQALVEDAAVSTLQEAASHTSVMVALFPDAATAADLAIDGGEEADEMHMTLAFCGKAEGLNLRRGLQTVAAWAAMCPPELKGEISGHGIFVDGPVTYLSVDLPELPALRQRLVHSLEEAGMPASRDHGFTPHMTLDYARRRPKMKRTIPISFDRVTLAWADQRFSFPLGQSVTEPLLQEALRLIEGKWDPTLHPRWPKGTPKAGQFMHVGETFHSADGKEWQIAHIAGGKVIANRVGGSFKEAETGVFNPTKVSGKDSPIAEDTHVIKDAVKEGAPRALQSSQTKGIESGVATVDPYVDPASHNPALQPIGNSKIAGEEWKRFGEVDQEHYNELMTRFGDYSPGKAKTLIDESYKDYEGEVQSIVKNAYSSQYGSSTGFSLSLASIFHHFGGGKAELEKLDAQRKRALELQGRHKDVIAWDLYNRTRAPDVTIFHKNNNGPDYWQKMLSGKKPIMSGLSQSFNFGANWGFGSNTLATPVAIRHVLMSSYSAQPVPGQTHFTNELEISVAEQMKVDQRSLFFQLYDITENQKKWLMGSTKAPASGAVLERFRDALQKGEHLPTPPAPPDVQMQGSAQKLWIDPPPEAAEFTQRFSGSLPEQAGAAWSPASLDPSGPWAYKDEGGLPKPTIAKESELKPGDYMMGLKGTLYLIVEDPGDSTGFGLRYVKIENGKFTGESYNFEGGGNNQYFKLDKHYSLPDPHKDEQKTNLFDPHAYVNSTGEKFIAELKPGEKFKVNSNPYEIKTQLNGAHAQIIDLTDGKVGTINTDYKTHTLMPKDGYVPIEEGDEVPKLAPAKGLIFPHEGKKHVVTKVLKDGTVKAKPSGGKTIALSPDDQSLEGMFDPSAYKIGSKVKASTLSEGDLFHGGRGSTLRPYRVEKVEGNSVTWRSLETGQEGSFTKQKVVRLMEPADATPDPGTPKNTPTTQSWHGFNLGEKVEINPGEFGKVVGGVEGDNLVQGVEVEKPNGTFLFGPSSLKPAGAPAGGTGFAWDDYVIDATPKPLDELDAGDSFEMNEGDSIGMPFEVVYSLADTKGNLGIKNLATGEILQVPAATSTKPMHSKAGLSAIPHDSLTPGDMTTLGNLQAGDHFTDDGQTFQVIHNLGGEEKNVKVAMVTAGGNLAAEEEGWTYPDKAVYFAHAPKPAGDVPSGVGFPDLMVEGGFKPFKSKYGSGGKYTHDKISEMSVGSTFKGTDGKLWKVKEQGHVVVVTDGQAHYKVTDPSMRGRVVTEQLVDETGPVPGEHTPGAVSDMATGLEKNSNSVSIEDLPTGSVVQVDGIVQTIEKGSSGEMPAMTILADGSTNLLGYALVPDLVKLPDESPPGAAKADLAGVPFPVGDLKKGDSFFGKSGEAFKVVAHTADGKTVLDGPDGLLQVDGKSPIHEMTSAPPVETIADIGTGNEFKAGGKTFTVIAVGSDNKPVVQAGDGAIIQLEPGATTESPELGAPEAPLVSFPEGDWSTPVDEALAKANVEMDGVGTFEPEGFKSTWGSGAKYKHWRAEELETKTIASDKAGNVFVIVDAGPAGKTLAWKQGKLVLIPAKTRLKIVT